MKKLTILSLAALSAASAFVSCNDDYVAAEITSSAVAVTSFSLADDDSVLTNLDSVFFSIDLNRARIFNADSLPYGTKTTKLVPVISLLETPTAVTLTVKRADGTDTTYNYLTNSTDSIDFTNPVTLSVTSPSGAYTKSYSIEVNVHKVKTDSLVWNSAATRHLPSPFVTPTAQRTVSNASGLYCLSTDGVEYAIAHATEPEDEWATTNIQNMPEGADVHSFAATDDAFYILANSELYTSTDKGETWGTTGQTWYSIYGNYENRVIGTKKTGDTWQFVQYPGDFAATALPEGMPVSDASMPLPFTFSMGSSSQIVIVGGERADGTLSADTWAFDGTTWANITVKALPVALKNASVVPFFTFKVNKVFVADRYSILMAMGGNDGTTNSTAVYISFDFGMTWNKGSELIQLPETMSAFNDAQAFVFNRTLTDESAETWIEESLNYRIPGSASLTPAASMSRATAPITSWECPYIYTFGGVDNNGSLIPVMRRATLNRLTFKPIQ